MPAPMPIQIRYGPTGLLAQAAAASGGYAGNVEASRYAQTRYQQQQVQDQSFLAQMQNQQMQRDQMQYQQERDQKQLELEAQKLQLAQRGATPTSNAAFDATSPLARSIRDQKQSYLEAAKAQGVTGDALTGLEAGVKDPNTTVEAFQKRSQEHGDIAMKSAELAKKAAADNAALVDKQAIFQSYSPQLPADYVDAAKSLAGDSTITASQFSQKLADVIQQKKQAAQKNVQNQITGYDDQLDRFDAALREMRGTGSLGGVNPNQAPAELSGQFIQPGGWLEKGAQNFWNGVSFGAYTPSYIEKPPDITGIKKLSVYQQILNDRELVQKKRDALANPQEATAAAQSAGGEGKKPITPDLADLFMTKVGRDPVKARQLAESYGYSF